MYHATGASRSRTACKICTAPLFISKGNTRGIATGVAYLHRDAKFLKNSRRNQTSRVTNLAYSEQHDLIPPVIRDHYTSNLALIFTTVGNHKLCHATNLYISSTGISSGANKVPCIACHLKVPINTNIARPIGSVSILHIKRKYDLMEAARIAMPI